MLVPETSDHIQAAEIHNKSPLKGVQVGTIDALIAQLGIRYKLSLLTADKDFTHIVEICLLDHRPSLINYNSYYCRGNSATSIGCLKGK